jgi:uncharacterized Zn finger protein
MAFEKLTESIIRAGADEKSFERGEALYHDGAISNTCILDNILTGDCAGTLAPFYQVRVELDNAGVRSAGCTCPYEYGGYCKHVVALLLAYVHHPEQFIARQGLPDLLAGFSQGELIELIGHLANEHPELYNWIEIAVSMPSPGKETNQPHRKKLDDEVYRHQVRSILHSLDRMRPSEAYWHVGGMTNELAKVQDVAMQFLAAGDPDSALTIPLALIEEAYHGVEFIDDSDGYIGNFMIGLGQPLTEVILSLNLNQLERERLAGRLEKLDRELDQYGMSGLDIAIQAARYGWQDAPEEAHAHSNESYVEHGEGTGEHIDDEDWGDINNPWPSLADVKLNVLERQERTEEYLTLCQQVGRHLRYALKLCDLQRAPEAVAYARQHFASSEDALALAQRLREMRLVSDAIDIGEHGLTLEGRKAELGEWLGPIEEAQGRDRQALRTWLAAFPERPSLEHYKRLKRLAGAAWPKLQPGVMQALRQHYDRKVLAEVLLFEENWDEAIKLVEQSGIYDRGAVLAMVADGVMTRYPEWVADVCTKRAEGLIAPVQSSLYDEVAEWLRRVKQAYAQMGQTHIWQAYLQRLKDDYKRRPSLQARLKNL